MRVSVALLLATACGRAAAPDTSVAALMATVRKALHDGMSDRNLARLVHRAPLSERLGDPVIEQLETEGAGPMAVDELERRRELSRDFTAPEPLALFDAPPPADAAERPRIIDAARRYALQYTAVLPDFLCTETVRRFVDRHGKESWSALDALTIRVAYTAKGENYKLVAVNNRPATRPLDSLDGSTSEGEFGSTLRRVFLPESDTHFRWERWTKLRGRLAHVFSYRIDVAHSRYTMDFDVDNRHYHLVPASRGAVYVDRETSQVLRISIEADGLPPDYPIRRSSSVLDYGFTEVAGRRFLLPSRAVNRISLPTAQTRNVIEFHDYRKFDAAATIDFNKVR